MPDETIRPEDPAERREPDAPAAGGGPGPAERQGPAEPAPASAAGGGPGEPAPGPGAQRPAAPGGHPAAPGGYPTEPGAAGIPGGYPGQFTRRLTRRMDDRLIAGVASGLGAYFNVDPVVFRVGFVALTLAGGVGALIYLLCWIILPPAFGPQASASGTPGRPLLHQGQALAPVALRQGGWKTYLAIGAVLLALVLLFSPFTRPTVIFALLLIALGVLLMVQDQPSGERPPGQPGPGGGGPPGAAPPPGGGSGGGFQPGQAGPPGQWQPSATGTAASGTMAPAAGQQPPAAAPGATGVAPGASGASGTWSSAPPWGQPSGWGEPGGAYPPGASSGGAYPGGAHPGGAHPGGAHPVGARHPAAAPGGWGSSATAVMESGQRRPRPVLGWVTVALALLAGGVAGALDNFGAVHMTAATTLALMLTVIGAGLLVASVWGRGGWLILLGCLLIPVVAVTSVLNDVSVTGETGDQSWQPRAVADVRPEYGLAAGELRIDLSQVRFGPQATTIDARVAVGEMRITVPSGQPVTVHADATGSIQAFGREASGYKIHSDVTDDSNRSSERLGRLTLNLRVGVGSIIVQRGP
jgi:phage shock protein PspC (stress-responsive transcriptional regulator)